MTSPSSVSLAGVRAILLDIEGTVAPVSFVYDVLFPYARRHLRDFLFETWEADEVQAAVAALATEYDADRAVSAPPLWPAPIFHAAVSDYALWLMDRDRKSPGLKALQGLIWQRGYNRGELRGELFADVAPACARWHDAGIRIAIYSSGSVLAQQLIFRTAPSGDLTPLISDYFDTAVGPKTAPDSYARIVSTLALQAASILFISDVTAELIAARDAGMRVILSVRPGNAPAAPAAGISAVTTFDSIVVSR